NNATIIGFVGQDPEMNNVGELTVVTFSVATSESRKGPDDSLIQRTQWHKIVSWDQIRNMTLIDKVHKGDMVYVEGSLRYKTFAIKDGTERNRAEIVLKSLHQMKPKEPQQEPQQEHQQEEEAPW
ncbi:hypothetical protein BGZ65_000267, partial [Modicella reniformis]